MHFRFSAAHYWANFSNLYVFRTLVMYLQKFGRCDEVEVALGLFALVMQTHPRPHPAPSHRHATMNQRVIKVNLLSRFTGEVCFNKAL